MTEYISSIIPFIKKHNISVKGIIHIGANDCIEYQEYSSITNNILYIEANPEIVDNIKLNVGYEVYPNLLKMPDTLGNELAANLANDVILYLKTKN